ncbi:MAG: hypothetical protein JWN25_1236 [Verrucomicrobiales bacterium]|nr:hypothetical protein [Verrucomicrobiales bacterium]
MSPLRWMASKNKFCVKNIDLKILLLIENRRKYSEGIRTGRGDLSKLGSARHGLIDVCFSRVIGTNRRKFSFMRFFGLTAICLLMLLSLLTYRTSRVEKGMEKEDSQQETVIVQQPNRLPEPEVVSAAEAHTVSREEAIDAYMA